MVGAPRTLGWAAQEFSGLGTAQPTSTDTDVIANANVADACKHDDSQHGQLEEIRVEARSRRLQQCDLHTGAAALKQTLPNKAMFEGGR